MQRSITVPLSGSGLVSVYNIYEITKNCRVANKSMFIFIAMADSVYCGGAFFEWGEVAIRNHSVFCN